MDTEVIIGIVVAVGIPTGLWLKERYARLMADGKITLDEVIGEVKALGKKAEEVKADVEEILEEE